MSLATVPTSTAAGNPSSTADKDTAEDDDKGPLVIAIVVLFVVLLLCLVLAFCHRRDDKHKGADASRNRHDDKQKGADASRTECGVAPTTAPMVANKAYGLDAGTGSNGKLSATDGQPAAARPPAAPVYKTHGGGGGENYGMLAVERPASTTSDVYHVLDRGADTQAAAPGVYGQLQPVYSAPPGAQPHQEQAEYSSLETSTEDASIVTEDSC